MDSVRDCACCWLVALDRPAAGETILLGVDAMGRPPGVGFAADLSGSDVDGDVLTDAPEPASRDAGWMGED